MWKIVYNSVLRRWSTFTLASVFGAIFFERGLEVGTDYIFRTVNKGKLWDDIKHNYE